MKNELAGVFTVEAAVLVPLLLWVMVSLVYTCIFLYDRTMMIQDVNSIAVLIRDKGFIGEDSEKVVCGKAFIEISKNHPYIAMKDLVLSIDDRGSDTTVGMAGSFEMPLGKLFSSRMRYEKKIERVEPLETMYTIDMLRLYLGEED